MNPRTKKILIGSGAGAALLALIGGGLWFFWPEPGPVATASSDPLVAAIKKIAGEKISIVVDDSKSMWEKVSLERYLTAAKRAGKTVHKVYYFADGAVREAGGDEKKALPKGDHENTRGALEEAAKSKPDGLVLVTDEVGEDWEGFKDLKLPPVVVVGIDIEEDDKPVLQKVGKITGGTYVDEAAPVASL